MNKNLQRGQTYAFIISMTVIIGGIVLILRDKETAGIVSLLTGAGDLARLFIPVRDAEKSKDK